MKVIEEIHAGLDYDNYAIMVVDNCSPNESAEILEKKSKELNDYLLVWNAYQSEYFGKTIDISMSKILEKFDLLCSSIDSAKTEMLKNKCSLIESASAAFMQLEKLLEQ